MNHTKMTSVPGRLAYGLFLLGFCCCGALLKGDDPPQSGLPHASLTDEQLLTTLRDRVLPVSATGGDDICVEVARRRSTAMTQKLIALFQTFDQVDEAIISPERVATEDRERYHTATPLMKIVQIIRVQETPESWAFLQSLVVRDDPILLSVVLDQLCLSSNVDHLKELSNTRSTYLKLLVHPWPLVRCSALRVICHMDCNAKESADWIKSLQRTEKTATVVAQMKIGARDLEDLARAWDLLCQLSATSSDDRLLAATALGHTPGVLDGRYVYRRTALEKMEAALVTESDDRVRDEIERRIAQYRESEKRDASRAQ